ncbi:MAG: CoA activase [candidate division Zixibacteria bacterium HGW-Zixibacteria-1]|nr:MAG: CoA activase [candidate division Zixibacteria bacterium HGW-Zixibacteria-1]
MVNKMQSKRPLLGIDIGSVSVKIAALDHTGRIIRTIYRRFHGRPYQTLKSLLDNEFREYKNVPVNLGFTGIGSKTAVGILGGDAFGEINVISIANFALYPEIVTIIEMGGEDSKFIQLDPVKKVVVDFSMNNLCAAGTGSFLDQQAGRLKISIEEEFGKLALKSKNPPRIAGRCSVFAKSDMIHLQQIATPDFDIVAGLCYAVARNFKSAIARGKKFIPPVAFEGGVAANPGVIRAFTDILEIEDGQLIVPEHFNVIGAIGAAMMAGKSTKSQSALIDTHKISGYLNYREIQQNGRERLTFDYPDSKYYAITAQKYTQNIDNLEVYLGIDVGSLSTNLVLIDKDKNVVARRYLMTEGRPIEAVRRGLEEIGDEVGIRVKVVGVGTTGSGRYLTGDFVGADIIKNEITAQATAAINIDPTVDTIFEIGGQDSKYISLNNKTVIDFEMNKACTAGTGSFLQEQAEKLDINIEREFGDRALAAECPVGCGERCTVFMESDLVSHQRGGASTNDLIAGLAYSIASNYLTKVVGDRKVGDNIFFQGGVAWNKGVVAAFEKLTGKKVTVPPHHDVTGAIGAAILAMEVDQGNGSNFKGFDLSRRKYVLSTFTCEDCSNMCEIHKVEVEGEEPLYYGSRCEKYDVKRREEEETKIPDYVNFRQRLLMKRYIEHDTSKPVKGRVGIPRILQFFEYFPYWRAFFETLGFEVVNSDLSNHEIVEDSLEMFSAETCFPVKMTFGHVQNLIKKQVDYIFLPGIIKFTENENMEKGSYICPYVQSISNTINAKFDFKAAGIEYIGLPIRIVRNKTKMFSHLQPLLKVLHAKDKDLKRAIENGMKAYDLFRSGLITKGKEILDSLEPDEKCIVLVSRPYNGIDRRLSLEIPSKIRKMGLKVIPIDFLPLDLDTKDLATMYWLYGRKIMAAASFIRKHPNLYAVYLTSFGCGPDSFITHFFRRLMSGKPYLQLELDEHSADAGLITRVEAFLDSLRFYSYHPSVSEFSLTGKKFSPRNKIVYVPNMCDHAYPIAASLKRFGVNAEVLPEPDETSLYYGKKFTSGKECFPCVVTTGDMIRQVKSKDFKPDDSVFLMFGAEGPCRFGQYSKYHRIVLDELGYPNVPIFSPNSNNSYSEFGLGTGAFRKLGWRSVIFVDCLIKSLLKTRPYETEKGTAEKVYYKYLHKVQDHILAGGDPVDLAKEAAKEFSQIPVLGNPRPVVGLVGEIYLRNNRFSNNHLITKLEKLGMEVKLATLAEWVNYTTYTFRLDSIYKKNWKGVVAAYLQQIIQSRDEHKMEKSFDRHLPIDHEDSVINITKLAAPYLPIEVRGEAVLSIGKSIDFVRRGASGIINCMPFNCMPGTIVSSLSRKVSHDFHDIPWLNISYEGLKDTGEETRLEAFVDQVTNYSNSISQKIITYE